MTGFWVVLGIGLLVLAVAALRDRRSRLAAEAATGAPTSTLGRERPPVPDAATRTMLDEFRATHERVDAPLAHEGMANLSAPLMAAVTDAEVLCCVEAPSGLRELVGSRAVARQRMRPLVVVCPTMDSPTLAEVAVASGDQMLVVLVADAETATAVAGLVTAHPATRADLQSGAAGNFHGRAAHLVADASGCWIEPLEA